MPPFQAIGTNCFRRFCRSRRFDPSSEPSPCLTNFGGAIWMRGKRKSWIWEHLTWPELRDRVPSQPVVVLSIASVEDHGPHLPMDVDNFLIRSICEAAGEANPDELLLLPHFPFGFET